MKSHPFVVYPRLYLHVMKLTLRAIGRKWAWLVIAPAAAMLLMAVSGVVAQLVPGIAGGFLLSFVRAAVFSLVLYVARSIIEQRALTTQELTTGLGAFLGDVLTIFFALWVVGLVLGFVAPLLVFLLWLLVFAMPTFETVALTPVAGLSMFTQAFQFLKREAGPWLLGHVPLLALLPLHIGWQIAVGFVPVGLLPAPLLRPALDLLNAVPWVLWFVAFLYRGVLFLTLDSMSPRARADRFGSTHD